MTDASTRWSEFIIYVFLTQQALTLMLLSGVYGTNGLRSPPFPLPVLGMEPVLRMNTGFILPIVCSVL